ncbi:flagellar motor switch protein FliN, partial [Cellulomonas bogoriensis 69B4 = DSM 16987]
MPVLPTARHDAQTAAIVRAAAGELARLLPSAVTLEVAEPQPSTLPGPQSVAVRAGFVGTTSAELIVVADQAVAEALAGTDATISVADALRPALEAASATLGPGVLDEAHEAPLGAALEESDVVTMALVGPDGAAQAWFAMRVRQRPEAVPQQRGAAAERSPLRLLHDVEMTLTAEIGR